MSIARPTLLGLPYDASSSFKRGAAKAPPVIRSALASRSSNTWSEDLVDMGLPLNLGDAGDLELSDASQARQRIEAGVRELVGAGLRPISLGGDHSVTYPIMRALAPRYPGLTILQIDAHGDLYPEYDGDRYSHACPFARIMEDGLVMRLVQVGIRTLSPVQRENADRYGVEVFDMRAWASGSRPALRGPVYLSVDLDGLDPAFAPGVSHHEPGGLTTRDVVSLIQGLPAQLVGADVVEFNPDADVNGMTAAVCAKLVKEIASRMLRTVSGAEGSATTRG